ncbi:hypothetical protein BJX99DRAFT_136337 [Aspergillus californicus]
MEGCVSGAPGGLTTAFSILISSLLLPIFLMLCVFVLFIDARIIALTRPLVSAQTKDESTDDEMASCPSPLSIDLLDGIEEIQIPILCPQAVTPVRDENTPPLLVGSDALLDFLVERLKAPTFEPKCAPSIALTPTRKRDATHPNTKKKTSSIVAMWDGNISWALKGASIFDDADEEFSAFNSRSNMLIRQPYSELWVFQYGLRYIPTISERDAYRTIRIEQLSCEKTLNQILPHVVGEIYSAQLANTVAMTGYNTAMITFVTTNDALQFVAAIASQTVAVPGNVVPVHTPTYPIPADMARLIVDEGYTRSIGIFHHRKTLRAEISRILTRPGQMFNLQVESVYDGPAAGEISVKMFSVKAAAGVMEMLKRHASLGNCQFRFLKQDAFEAETALMARNSANANWY